MVDIPATISVDVFCNECTGALDAEYNAYRHEVTVELCKDCLESKYDEGVKDGTDAAE